MEFLSVKDDVPTEAEFAALTYLDVVTLGMVIIGEVSATHPTQT